MSQRVCQEFDLLDHLGPLPTQVVKLCLQPAANQWVHIVLGTTRLCHARKHHQLGICFLPRPPNRWCGMARAISRSTVKNLGWLAPFHTNDLEVGEKNISPIDGVLEGVYDHLVPGLQKYPSIAGCWQTDRWNLG